MYVHVRRPPDYVTSQCEHVDKLSPEPNNTRLLIRGTEPGECIVPTVRTFRYCYPAKSIVIVAVGQLNLARFAVVTLRLMAAH